ncbi:MAG: TetR/AcrR family transcriptional regulator [Sneathiella sp.]
MSEPLTKRERTHQRMLVAAGESFRSSGFSGIGVDGIAKAAGVTSGALYAHFGSKKAAFHEALKAGLDEVIAAIPVYQSEHGANWVVAFSDYYLGRAHREDLAGGCAMASLTSEIVRAEPDLQAEYEGKMTKIAELICRGLKEGPGTDRIARAWAMLGTLIGGLNIVRAMESNDAAENIAKAIKIAAITAAGEVSSPN